MTTSQNSEVTAEWTVRAQLKLIHPYSKNKTDPVLPHLPKTYVYKWSSNNPEPIIDSFDSSQVCLSKEENTIILFYTRNTIAFKIIIEMKMKANFFQISKKKKYSHVSVYPNK